MSTPRSVQIPLDSRLFCASLWLTAFTLAFLDTLDDRLGILALWAGMLVIVAAVWTVGLLLSFSRRTVLQVMSYEHQQQTPMLDGSRGSLTSL